MRRLAILGASGHGKVIADAALLSGWDEVIFYDDAWPEKEMNGRWPIVGNTAALLMRILPFDGVVVGIGNNKIRLEKTQQLALLDLPVVTIVHPSAVISPFSMIGYGSVVLANSVVQVDTSVGVAALINTSSTVDHDCVLADGVHICPGAHLAGGVHVGEKSWIGIGSSIKQLVNIGANVMIGAGAVVVTDIVDSVTVAGVPARILCSEKKC
ncbi:acetyltransferase [Deefgea tanakiae]|uniref:Acetyltransferase n=1 Tax=Deefgea tanakiae TaxID=2865840 RepID=A0ABX8Z6V4_9NEIS|nr:acetyltransferase [Deefgea tanakiae]QZA78321.1 acetyltransferase [Deefgea tanakiae]